MKTHSVWRKTIASALIYGLVFGQLVQTANAASTDISNVPMAVRNIVPANVMFTVDSSGGMDVDVLLPTFNSMYYENNVTNSNQNNLNGFFWLFPFGQNGIYNLGSGYSNVYWETLGSANNPDPLAWRARDYEYNKQFYNPNKTYYPWPGTDINGNAFGPANPQAALLDPYNPSAGSIDLTQTITYDSYTYLNSSGTGCLYAGCPWNRITPYHTSLYPATYYTWNDANNNGVMDAGEGVKYEIKPATPSYPSGRNYTQELQNFANWFQYYRTVMLSLKGATGTQLGLMGSTRVGMTDLEHNAPVAPVADMSVAANLSTLRSKIYNITPNLSDWRQPFHERIYNIWSYYNSTGSDAPVQYACQANYNILVTPGYLNENGPGASGFTNYFTNVTPPTISPSNYDGTAASPLPWGSVPYSDSYSDTLADWVAYYYDKPMLTGTFPTGKVPIPANTHETNTNLHMTTYVLAPGAVPVLGNPPPAPGRGLDPMTVDPYTINPAISWPQPIFVGQSTVDDLWHAAVNGRGVFVNSSDVAGGLSAILNDIVGRTGAAAAVAVSNANVVPGDNYSYASSYNSGTWSGDLNAYTIDTTTGQPSSTPAWGSSAQAQLDSQTWTSRKIATYSGSAGIPFTWSSLSSTQQSLLNTPYSPPGTSDGSSVLNYLRGDRSQENAGVYRQRAHVLGDIINAEPVLVREPTYAYADAGYSAFKTANANRTKMIYQGANDGMLHALTAATGGESWAYVPGILLNNERLGGIYGTTSSLVNLSRKTGFTHLYYVDGTPTAGDVDFQNTQGATGSGSDWRTILVGGLRKGGHGFYALDVTNPAASTDADVAAKALWEFPNSGTSAAVVKNIGYSFAKPIIVKTRAAGWVVLVTSGYNNGADTGGDGQGHLFVLNARTGALIKDLSTGVGSSASPSGLAQISAYVDNSNVDNTTDIVYGGDLQGNVWRFDLSRNNANQWSVSKLTTLTDGSGVAQPITTAPELGLVNNKRMIYVGTGQYLGESDVPGTSANANASQTQTMYGLYDDMTGTALTNLRGTNGSTCPSGGGDGSLVCQSLTTNSSATPPTRSISPTNPVNLNTKKGWYVDLPDTGERVVTDPTLALGALIFTSNIPSNADPCAPGGSSWLYVLDYSTGGYIPGSLVSWSAMSLGNTLASRPILIQLPSGGVDALVRKSDATTSTTQVPLPPTPSNGKRVSWREIISR